MLRIATTASTTISPNATTAEIMSWFVVSSTQASCQTPVRAEAA